MGGTGGGTGGGEGAGSPTNHGTGHGTGTGGSPTNHGTEEEFAQRPDRGQIADGQERLSKNRERQSKKHQERNRKYIKKYKCLRPRGWCAPGYGATYQFKDCDGDGIPDATCRLGNQFGIISTHTGCHSTWPNGKCVNMKEAAIERRQKGIWGRN